MPPAPPPLAPLTPLWLGCRALKRLVASSPRFPLPPWTTYVTPLSRSLLRSAICDKRYVEE